MRRALVGFFAILVAAGSSRAADSPARAEVERLIQESGAEVAVAFRTFDGGQDLLIQPDVDFHAASTMKVPVMIELYRQARGRFLELDDRIPGTNQFHSIVDGSPYSRDASDDSDREA